MMETQPQEVLFSETLYQVPSLMEQYRGQESEVEEKPNFPDDHDENLAFILKERAPGFLARLGAKICEEIDQDLESRKEWENNIKDKFEQIGLKVEYRSFPFDGASGSYSPLMAQEIVKSYAMTVSELLPQEGPAKNIIMGEVTEELKQRADKIENFFNYYLLNEIDYYADFEKMQMWNIFSGSVVRKVYYDPFLKKLNTKFVTPYNFIVNYDTSDLKSCWRMTEVISMDKREISQLMQTGVFLDINLENSEEDEDNSVIKRQVDKTEGISNPNYENRINETFYECHIYLDDEELFETDDEQNSENENEESLIDSQYRPYIVKIHKTSQKIVAIHRNWEKDTPYERKEYYIDYGYIPGFGFYKLGAAHLIGGLSSTSTTLLRQTLDANTLSNFPAGLRVKGMVSEDNNIRLGPTEFKEVDTGGLPIQQAVMTMPYRDPSPLINELRKDLESSGSMIMGTATTQLADVVPNAPVGTTFALLDNLLVIQSIITRACRNSMTREFRLMYRRFSEYMKDVEFTFYRSNGQFTITGEDFTDLVSIEPVADPHITTKLQRLIRAQTIRDASLQRPDLYDAYESEKYFLNELKLPDSQIDLLLPDRKKIDPLDPITENQNLIIGKGAKAAIEQDHSAHILIHQMLLSMPNANPITVEATNAHIAEHMALGYQLQMQNLMGGMIMPEDRHAIDMSQQNQFAQMAAMAVSQYQSQQAANQPPPPIDPSMVLLEKVKVEDKAIDQRADAEDLKTRTKAFEAQLDYDAKMKELELKNKELEAKIASGKI